jgi:hypothetical protein
MELSQLEERREAVIKEIRRLESVAVVVREFDPFTVIDEQIPSPYAHLKLKSKTLTNACEAILRVKGEATSRELLDILVAEGKLLHGKNSSLISVINSLKSHPDRFWKDGITWSLNPALLTSPLPNGDGPAKRAAET